MILLPKNKHVIWISLDELNTYPLAFVKKEEKVPEGTTELAYQLQYYHKKQYVNNYAKTQLRFLRFTL